MTQLDIFSDPICPWCYIGKTFLNRALAAHPEHSFSVRWHPFQLNPEMPATGMDRRTYLETKFGDQKRAVQVYGEIAKRAEDAGLSLDFGAIKRTPNTLNAHRLIHWAGLEDQQTPVAEALFRAYFEDGRDIGADDVLCDIADKAGMDRKMVAKLLDGDADIKEIQEEGASARGMGMTGVPTFVVAAKHVLNGAQPTELWSQVITEIADLREREA